MIEEIAGGSVQKTFTYGNVLICQNEIGSDQVSFFGLDAHGSVRLLTNTSGEISDTYDYDAFGNAVDAFGGTRNDYLYSGERFDPNLGAYHLRERYYNQQRGRFLTRDPFAAFTDLPRTLHRYSYVGADPVNFIDPSGLAETHEYGHNTPGAQLCARVGVVLDAASLIAALTEGALPELDAALAGRQPLVPIRAAREYLKKNSPDVLRAFLSDRGGRIAHAGSQSDAKGLQNLARTLGSSRNRRVLRSADAEIAASALREGTNVITRDRKFRNFLRHAYECGKILITGETF